MARRKSETTENGAASEGTGTTSKDATGAEDIRDETTAEPVETADRAATSEATDQVQIAESPDRSESYQDLSEGQRTSDPELIDPSAVEPGTSATETSTTETHEDIHEDEAGPSFASRALTWLVLLLAGAGVGIWAAPKIAPALPSGMAPVAAWLSPGQAQSESRIAEIEARLETGLGEVSARVAELAPADDLSARIDAAVAEVRTSLGAEVEDLRGRIGQIDDTETRQRIASIESAVEAGAAELESLKTQLTGGAAATAGLSEDTVARIDTYQAEVEGLRASLASQSDRVGALAARIDEVASEADRQIETARARVAEIETEAASQLSAAAAESETASLRAALASGAPFADALRALSADPTIEVPESLATAADQGVSTLLQLKESFPDAAHAAIRASIMASAGEGLLGRSNAFLRAQVASRSLTPQEGMSPDAVLSRMEDSLRNDDLAGALDEATGLPSEAADAMSGWLEEARSKLAAEAGLEALNSALPATN